MTSATRWTARLGQELTDRETQILRGVANGQSNVEIGRELYLTENTVKSHLQRASRKLGATGRAHAVARALQQGVLTLRDIQPPTGTTRRPPRPPRAVQRVGKLLTEWQHSRPPAPHLADRWWAHKLTQLAAAINDQEHAA